MSSAKIAAIIGLLLSVSIDLSSYSMSNMFNNFSALIVDILVYSVMLTITGVVVALVIRNKEA